MGVISINYEEGGSNEYFSIDVHPFNGEKRIFDSGDLIQDWFKAIKFWAVELENEPLVFSSTVDHFIMDTDKYDRMYLSMENDNPKFSKDYTEDGIMYFVKKGEEPTIEEFKKRLNGS